MKYLFFILVAGLSFISCGKNSTTATNTIPVVSVYHQLNLTDPLYTKLNFPNGYVILDGDGVKGILVTNSGGQIYALERDCPYNPNDACAQVSIETSGNTIRCGKYDTNKKWVSCCDSRFTMDGTLLSGPAKYSLKRYSVMNDGTTVTITN